FGTQGNRLYVVTGPVIRGGCREVLPAGICAPRSFFKVALLHTGPTFSAIAFIVPQEAVSTSLSRYVRSVDDVEEATGLDFFATLPDDIEAEVEAKILKITDL